jgi:hypothetical protein
MSFFKKMTKEFEGLMTTDEEKKKEEQAAAGTKPPPEVSFSQASRHDPLPKAPAISVIDTYTDSTSRYSRR